jgi:hypothetical protein
MTNIDEAIAQFTERIVVEIRKKYRISFDIATELVSAGLAANRKLIDKIKVSDSAKDVERTREFKETVKEVKTRVYFLLRKYHRDKEGEKKLIGKLEEKIRVKADITQINKIRNELLTMHSSTAERFEHYAAFYDELSKIISPPEQILDIACGLHPLSYPFEKYKPKRYVAIDRDVLCVAAIKAFSQTESTNCIQVIQSDINDIEWSSFTASVERFDIAFMLKLIPLLTRQDKKLLEKLALVPAKRILITGNEQALAKKRTISRREDNAIRRFIEFSGRRIISDFRIPGEFGYLVE